MFRSGPYKYNMNDFGHSMAAITRVRGISGGQAYPVYKAKAPLSRTGGRLQKMPKNKEPTRGIKKKVKGRKAIVKGKEAFRGRRKKRKVGCPRRKK